MYVESKENIQTKKLTDTENKFVVTIDGEWEKYIKGVKRYKLLLVKISHGM